MVNLLLYFQFGKAAFESFLHGSWFPIVGFVAVLLVKAYVSDTWQIWQNDKRQAIIKTFKDVFISIIITLVFIFFAIIGYYIYCLYCTDQWIPPEIPFPDSRFQFPNSIADETELIIAYFNDTKDMPYIGSHARFQTLFKQLLSSNEKARILYGCEACGKSTTLQVFGDYIHEKYSFPVIYIDCEQHNTVQKFEDELREQLVRSLSGSTHALTAHDVFMLQTTGSFSDIFKYVRQVREKEGYSAVAARFAESYYGADAFLASFLEGMASTAAEQSIDGLLQMLRLISFRHPTSKPCVLLDGFQALQSTEDGSKLVQTILDALTTRTNRPIGFPLLIEMSDDLFFSSIFANTRYLRGFTTLEINEFEFEHVKKVELGINDTTKLRAYEKIGGNPMLWIILISNLEGYNFEDKYIDPTIGTVCYPYKILEFERGLDHFRCFLHWKLLQHMQEHQFNLKYDLRSSTNQQELDALIKEEIAANILYFDGHTVRPQNIPIRDHMKETAKDPNLLKCGEQYTRKLTFDDEYNQYLLLGSGQEACVGDTCVQQ